MRLQNTLGLTVRSISVRYSKNGGHFPEEYLRGFSSDKSGRREYTGRPALWPAAHRKNYDWSVDKHEQKRNQ